MPYSDNSNDKNKMMVEMVDLMKYNEALALLGK